MKRIAHYFSLVKFSHTIFAMPFALIGFTYGLVSTGTPFSWALLVKILLCMVFARNTAMGFNRWADRDFDAENPRTAEREIPAGKISEQSARVFIALNVVGFIIVTSLINFLTFILSPVALFVIMGYSYTKRFTAWTHLVLGLSLAIAPVGAYIAVTGQFAIAPIILAVTVLTWVSGFDILYALQDSDFDSKHKLHSIPSDFSQKAAVGISIALHIITALTVVLMGVLFDGGTLYWIGGVLFIGLLVVQQIIFTPENIGAIAARFGLMNGISSITFASFVIADMLIH